MLPLIYHLYNYKLMINYILFEAKFITIEQTSA